MGYVFNPFTGTLDAVGSGGGSGTPAGPDTSVQFNDGGSFGGDAALTWDKTTTTLTISDTSTDGVLTVNGNTVSAAQSGSIRLPAFGAIATRNNANTADTQLALGTVVDGLEATQYADGWLVVFTASGIARFYSRIQLDAGKALSSDTTDAHTALLQAYDVDGAAYKTFATLTNGNTPSLTIAEPAGGALFILPPTSDPHVAGALWNNSGLAVISSG